MSQNNLYVRWKKPEKVIEYNKTFFTYDEQIEKLKKEKQLVISDPEFTKNTLQKLSYFSLIGGYKDLFKHKPSGNYLHGVTFEEITAFYYFDEELRTLFLKYILHVEQQLKSISHSVRRLFTVCFL